jgi:hypothetical protein
MSRTTNTASGLNAAVRGVITDLASKLSPNAKIVTEQGEEWTALLERWSDLEKQTPAAIIAVATEADVQETVCTSTLQDTQMDNSNIYEG